MHEVLVAASFLACAVEMIEALTIVLAVGVTYVAAHHGANRWWLLPLTVTALLASWSELGSESRAYAR
jgi:uncharacterized membrane protein